MPSAETIPMFPLNTVLFPGVSVPLHVFEERYRALVAELLDIEDPAQRVFGSVAIREGYEVGERGAQSVHRIGTLLQLTESRQNPDGSYEIEVVGRQRLRLEAMDTSETYLRGIIRRLDEDDSPVRHATVREALAAFRDYRAAVSHLTGSAPLPTSLPKDPTFLSWTLAANALLTQEQGMRVLDCPGPAARLAVLTDLLRRELELMTVMPSLPATRLGRTSWNPN